MEVKNEKLSKTDPDPNIGVDRISDLPEFIVHDQIMSRLSKRDRARTGFLSKKWYRLNKTYPALDFNFNALVKVISEFSHDSPEFCKSLKSFIKCVDKSLGRFSRRNLCLKSFCVRSRYDYSEYSSDLDRWAESAIDNNVEKLKLYCNSKSEYSLPRRVYFSKTLTTLKLKRCVLDQPLSAFRSLRKLTLSHCCLKKGPLLLKQSDFPALESLVIFLCYGVDSIHVSDLAQLHTVKITFTIQACPKIVEIASQSVQKLSMEDHCYVENPWSRINVYGCSCLKFLHLYSNTITDQVFHALLSKLPLLEDLYVTGCRQLEAVQVSSPQLKTLLVWPCTASHLKSIDIKVTTIKNFIFSSYSKEDIEIKVQADCCLETLVLGGIKTKIDKLVAKFPLLQSLSIFGCHELETIEIQNLHLKKLHIARCLELKDVKVASRKLEMYCTDREDLKILIPDPEYTYEIQSCNPIPYNSYNGCRLVCFQKMIVSLVKDKHVAACLCTCCCCY